MITENNIDKALDAIMNGMNPEEAYEIFCDEKNVEKDFFDKLYDDNNDSSNTVIWHTVEKTEEKSGCEEWCEKKEQEIIEMVWKYNQALLDFSVTW